MTKLRPDGWQKKVFLRHASRSAAPNWLILAAIDRSGLPEINGFVSRLETLSTAPGARKHGHT
jgi:hypothetical protein